ncbi:lectin 7-like [Rosa rugosa]|uniref:lectin 7-like n=1 Tax=Rosa rugosa TaxID=74645 RepID=UPI002B40FBCE|nr:lectin 7-like [Rosa rugosa]
MPTATSIIYEGDAEPVDGVVELTNKVLYVGRVGRATYAKRVPEWDSHNRKFSDFNTHFSFLIDKKGRGTYGSGFAFYLAPCGYQIPPNSGGGFLGLFNKTTSDVPGNQVVLVEFDYYTDDEWDPACQHVGINSNSIASEVYTPWKVNLHNGETTEVWINYNATTRNLSVQWSYKNHPADRMEETTSLSYIIDLTKILPEWVSIGFSASTSQYGERHKILSWQFDSSLDAIPPAEDTKLIRVIRYLAFSVIILIIGVFTLKTAELWWQWLKYTYGREELSKLVPEASVLSSTHEDGGETEARSRRLSDPDVVIATDSLSNNESNLVDLDTAMKKKEKGKSIRM